MPSARSGPPAATNRSGNCPVSDESERLWDGPTVSHTGDKWERCLLATKKIKANGLVRGGRPEAFLARQVPTSGRRRTVAKTDSCGWRPACEIRP